MKILVRKLKNSIKGTSKSQVMVAESCVYSRRKALFSKFHKLKTEIISKFSNPNVWKKILTLLNFMEPEIKANPDGCMILSCYFSYLQILVCDSCEQEKLVDNSFLYLVMG